MESVEGGMVLSVTVALVEVVKVEMVAVRVRRVAVVVEVGMEEVTKAAAVATEVVPGVMEVTAPSGCCR